MLCVYASGFRKVPVPSLFQRHMRLKSTKTSLRLAVCGCHFGVELEHGLMCSVDKRATALEKNAPAWINESVGVKQLSSEAANTMLMSLSHLSNYLNMFTFSRLLEIHGLKIPLHSFGKVRAFCVVRKSLNIGDFFQRAASSLLWNHTELEQMASSWYWNQLTQNWKWVTSM